MTDERRPFRDGPFLSAAFFCEQTLEEKDGVISVVRVVDRLVTTATGLLTPEAMPGVRVSQTLFIAFKSGQARGRHDLTLAMEDPSGIRQPLLQNVSVLFEGDERGANLIFKLDMSLTMEGLYWVDVLLDEERVTRVPLRLVYQRVQRAGQPRSR